MTAALQPPLTSVPFIVFNKQPHKQEDSTLAQTNFVKALCQYIQGDKPAECLRNAGFSPKFNLALVAIISAVLFYY